MFCSLAKLIGDPRRFRHTSWTQVLFSLLISEEKKPQQIHACLSPPLPLDFSIIEALGIL